MSETKYRAAIISLGSISSQMTAVAMRKYFSVVDELHIKRIEVVLGQDNPILYEGKPIEKYDCVYVKGSFRFSAISRSITSLLAPTTYLPVSSESFTVVHDKILTHVNMQGHDIPMPKTYLSSTPAAAKELLRNLAFPIIMKFPHGTQGKGVMFAESYPAASSLLDALQSLKQPFLIQEYIETGGADIRVFVVGDRVVAAMKRTAASGEKRSNIHAGGTAEVFEPSAAIRKVALKTARAIGAEICGIDILESVKGPVVIEANLSPGLQGITAATGRDIADDIAHHLFDRTHDLKTRHPKPAAQEIIDELGPQKPAKVLLGPLDFRGSRILLPEVVSTVSGITDQADCTLIVTKGKVEIKKGI